MRTTIGCIVLIVWTGSTCLPPAVGNLRAHGRDARATVANTIVPCDARAYMIDHDVNGTNIRSGPGAAFKVIGNLPTKGVEGIAVHITGSNGDWVRIDHAVEEGGEQERIFFPSAPEGEKPVPPKAGWVHTTLLGVSGMAVTKGGTNLYQQPMKHGRIVTRIPGGDDSVVVRGCRGGWMYIEYQKLKGWAAPDTLCANSLTTCV